MSNVVFRDEIRATDRERIRAITESSGFFSPEELVVAIEVFDDALRGPAAGYQYHIAEIDGEVVGYACWGKDTLTESSYELYWIAIDERFRSHGIGKQLMQIAEAAVTRACPTGAQLFIETAGREQYLPTRRFYERQGYQLAATIADYYAEGDAMVIYSRRLPRQ